MFLTIVNDIGPTGTQAHRSDCRDLTKHRGRDQYTADYATQHEVWADYNADFIAEGSGAWDIDFPHCTRGLPKF